MRHGLIATIRYNLIELLAGKRPVVLNMRIMRPKRYEGALVKFPDLRAEGVFSNNYLEDKEADAILMPRY